MTSQQRFGRRQALVGMGATALGATVVGPRVVSELAGADTATGSADAAASTAGSPPIPLAPPDDSVRALFGDLREGNELSTHWRLEALHGVRAGAIPVVVSTIYGGRFAVEIFRDDPDGPPPIARARGLALCLVNGGDGSSATNELAGLGVMALGRALEARRAEGAPLPPGLMTQPERMAAHPDGSFDVPLA